MSLLSLTRSQKSIPVRISKKKSIKIKENLVESDKTRVIKTTKILILANKKPISERPKLINSPKRVS